MRCPDRRSEIVEAASGVHVPRGWRSSYLNRDDPVLHGQSPTGEYAIILAKHHVPEQTVSIVRRLEAEPWRRTVEGKVVKYDLGPYPHWWNVPIAQRGAHNGYWDWAWNLGHAPACEPFNSILPGTILQSNVLGQIPGIMSIAQFEFADNWQRLASWPNGPIHHSPTRSFYQGPQIILLVAIVWANPAPDPQGTMADPPAFGLSFGSMEGIDVPAREFLRSPHRWLTS